MARVLVIDDERGVRFTLAEFLKDAGHEVETASDEPEAVSFLEANAVDVVVTDIILPRVSGADLLDRIRAAAPEAQIVVITGEPTVATAARAVRAKAHDYLPKPVSSAAIVRAVEGAAELKALTDRTRALEEDVRRHRDRLQELVETRTRQLAGSEEKYRLITDLALMGVGVADESGTVTYANLRLAEILGFGREGPEALLGKSFFGFLEASDRAWVRERWQARSTSTEPGRYELRFVTASGELRWVEILVRTLEKAERHATLANIIDISERKAAEQALRASEDRYRTLVERSPFGVALTDSTARIVEVNGRLCEIAGIAREDLVGHSAEEVLEPVDRERVARRGRALRAGEAVRDELFKTKTGRTVRVASEVLSSDPRALLHTVEDVTERRRLEDHLRQVQKMEAVGTLAGGVAHDINNVLGAIMGVSSLLHAEMSPDDPRLPDIEEILAACRRGRDLTRNLLGFARRGRQRTSPIDLNRLARSVVELLGRTLPKKIELTADLAHDLPAVDGDPKQIHHALMNLCLNAVEALGGSGHLVVRTRLTTLDAGERAAFPETLDGPVCLLEVVDDGAGMDQRTVERAFEPFFTNKEGGQASGLGLSMVYGTVRNHGGVATIDSSPGRGTTVRIYLPAGGGGGDAAARDEGGAPAPRAPRGRALLVDDEEMVRGPARRMLERLGFEVLLAGNGLEALAVFEEEAGAVDLVVLDVVMPVMDGEETFMALHARAPHVPVLICSGHAEDELAAALLAEGAAGFVQKPFDVARLSEEVDAALGRARRRAGPST